ncbi:MAG: alginate export family protein [Planctomycetota bacterium]
MRHFSISRTLAFSAVVASVVFLLPCVVLSQSNSNSNSNSNDDLLDRINRLEGRAQAQDELIQNLQHQLTVSDEARESGELELAVNGLLNDLEGGGGVTTPRSERLLVGGQLRLRAEARDPKNYGSGIRDDVDFVIQRTRLTFDFRVHDNVRVFVELQDSRNWGEEGSTVGDLEGVDLHQGYVDFSHVFGRPWTIRVGRQSLSFGDQRLVSPLDWHPVGRAWDGVRTWYDADDFTIDLFVTNVVENSTLLGGQTDDDHIFAGVYLTTKVFADHELDVYVFYRRFGSNSFRAEDGTIDDLEDVTLGFRFSGKQGGFDYSAEADLQLGDRAGDDVTAYAWAVTVGYHFGGNWNPRIGLEWTFASGDDDPTDGDYETFDPLFPFGHAFQGYADLFAWRNGHDLAVKVEASPTQDLWFQVAGHMFILDSDKDAWYNAGGGVIRRTTAGNVSNTVGFELDVHFKYNLNPSTSLWFGWSHFFAGDYVEDTGSSPDTDFGFFQVTINF